MTFPLPPRGLVGMVHLAALPGTPRYRLPVARIVDRAVNDARALEAAGFDAVIVENMGDVPYLARTVGPEIVACMTAALVAVRSAIRLPIGVQVLAGANDAAIAIALAGGASFVRVEGYVFASVADEGLLARADAGPLLRYRRAIGAESIAVLCDIRKKHSSHAITADLDVGALAAAAAFAGADGVIVTGDATGDPTSIEDLQAARGGSRLPVLGGSGATVDDIAALLEVAHAVIVGSSIKRQGRWDQPVDPVRAAALVEAARGGRRSGRGRSGRRGAALRRHR